MPKEPIFITPNESGFKGNVLDEYLALGFYRMQHKLFTLNFMRTDFHDLLLPMFWLRTNVHDIIERKTTKNNIKSCKPFDFTYKKAVITDETNVLYENISNPLSDLNIHCILILKKPSF